MSEPQKCYIKTYKNKKTGAIRLFEDEDAFVYPFTNEQAIMDLGFTLEQVRSADHKNTLYLIKK